jgi:glycerol-3-phosphate dehydrogenase
VLCCCGAVGGGGSMGSSVALLTARNDSNKEAVTRDTEVQSGRRRIVMILQKKRCVKYGDGVA